MVVGKLVEPENQALSRHFGRNRAKSSISRVNVMLAVTKKGSRVFPEVSDLQVAELPLFLGLRKV